MFKFRFLVIIILTFSFLDSAEITIPRSVRWWGGKVAFLKDKNKRKDDYPLLSAETFRSYADFILDEAIWKIDTDELFDGCIIFVGLRQLKDFYTLVLPHIEHKFVLISMGDEPFHHQAKTISWDTYRDSGDSYLTPKIAEHPKVIAFFSKNLLYKHPKCECIPIGKDYWHPEHTPIIRIGIEGLTIDRFFEEKKIDVYVNFNLWTHKKREGIHEHWKVQEGSYVIEEDRIPFTEYFNLMKNSKFALSPRGYGLDCYRTWEALYAGAIPVVESSELDFLYEGLPVILVDDLAKATLHDLEKEYEILKTKTFNLDRIFADYWFEKIRTFIDQDIERNKDEE